MFKKRILFLIVIGLGQGVLGFGQGLVYSFNQEKSEIAFNVKHLGVLTVDGFFNRFSGNISFEEDVPKRISCNINVGSLNTNENDRDNILKNEDYLDALSFPTITFESVAINRSKEIIHAQGLLKIKNIERVVDISFVYKIVGKDERIAMTGTTILKREDFALDFGAMNSLIGENINVKLLLVGIRN